MTPEVATHTFNGVPVALRASWPAEDYIVALIAKPGSGTEVTVNMNRLTRVE